MRFLETSLPGVTIVEPEPFADERGLFARTFCAEEFAAHDLIPVVAQASICQNRLRGTVRGMHYQAPPATEAKLVRCLRGAVLDIAIDVRPGSPTYLRHVAVELTAANRRALYVPEGFAHGYQVLEDDTELLYQMSTPYSPGHEGGLRYDDPALGVAWPLPVALVSEKDKAWPLLEPALPGVAR